jgi:hypothetical protein
MFGSVILEVIIGIIFINILVSTICSTIREGIEAKLKTRAAYLEVSIRQLLQDETGTGIARALYEHPLINSLFLGPYKPGKSGSPSLLAWGYNLPSYIPSSHFAIALMDIAARGVSTDEVSSDPGSPAITLASIRQNILNIGNPAVQRALLTAIDTAQGDLNTAQSNIENWFNGSMDRISGWYKRSTNWVIFWIGLAVAVTFNVNTITLVDFLYRNDAVRSDLVKRAELAVADTNYLKNANYASAKKELEKISLPVGWDNGWGALRRESGEGGVWNNFFGVILGWLLTAIAATLGAPFWFDMLNKVMVIRTTVRPPQKVPAELPEDRPKNQSPAGEQNAGVINNPGQLRTSALPEVMPAVRDSESNIDGCDVQVVQETPDEDLPPAEGGVADN